VQVGGQAHADRYMYIPMVGLLVMLIWGATEILEKLRAKRLAIPLAAAACLASAVLSWVQVGYWRNSETLFRHALAVTNDNSVANHNLGSYLMASGRLSEAFPYLETAVRIDPDSAPARTDLGTALGKMGRLPDAIAQLQIAVSLWPDAPKPHISLGTALAYAGRLPEAATEFESALRIDPDNAVVQSNLGLALSGIPGRLPDALRHLEEADRLRPDPELEQTIAHLRAEQQ
jgi:tetratricopeptide (TPR) repeat protein